MNNRDPNIIEWLALLAFVCLCFLGAARAFAIENGEAEIPPYTLYCDWSAAPGTCAGPGNPTLSVTRSTVQQCPNSATLISAAYTQVGVNELCVTAGVGALIEGQRYNYLGCAALTNAGCGESCAGGDLCLADATTGNTASMAVGEFTFWTRPATQTTLDLDICKASGGTVTINGVTLVAGSVCYGVKTVPATGTRISVTVSAAVLTLAVRATRPDFWQLEGNPIDIYSSHITSPVENVGALGTSTYRAATVVTLPSAGVLDPRAPGIRMILTPSWSSAPNAPIGAYMFRWNAASSGDYVYVNNGGWAYVDGTIRSISGGGAAINFLIGADAGMWVAGTERTLDVWYDEKRVHIRQSGTTAGVTADKNNVPIPLQGGTIYVGQNNTLNAFNQAFYGWVRQLKICPGGCREQLATWGKL